MPRQRRKSESGSPAARDPSLDLVAAIFLTKVRGKPGYVARSQSSPFRVSNCIREPSWQTDNLFVPRLRELSSKRLRCSSTLVVRIPGFYALQVIPIEPDALIENVVLALELGVNTGLYSRRSILDFRKPGDRRTTSFQNSSVAMRRNSSRLQVFGRPVKSYTHYGPARSNIRLRQRRLPAYWTARSRRTYQLKGKTDGQAQ